MSFDCPAPDHPWQLINFPNSLHSSLSLPLIPGSLFRSVSVYNSISLTGLWRSDIFKLSIIKLPYHLLIRNHQINFLSPL
jgi:hypothetical protein